MISSINSASASPVAAAPPTLRQRSAPESADAAPLAQQTTTAAIAEPAPVKETPATQQQLQEAVKAVSSFVGSVNNSLQFSVDDDSGRTLVKVVDIATKEVIMQIPSEEMLSIAKALDGIKGLLVQQKA